MYLLLRCFTGSRCHSTKLLLVGSAAGTLELRLLHCIVQYLKYVPMAKYH